MSEQKRNFVCPESGDEFFIPTYRTTFGSSGKVYKDKYGKEIKHPDTGVALKPIERKVDWSDGLAPATILGNDAASRAKRSEQLKERSKKHYKKEVAEVKYQKNKDLIKKYEGKD